MTDAPFVQSVLHPSDFSESSHTAFLHALAIVLFRQADFTVLHAVPKDQAVDVWIDSPRVRETLERWRVLEPDSPRSAVHDRLSIKISKMNVRSEDPLKAIVRHLDDRPTDLVVVSTEGRQGLPRWLKPSVAEGIARQAKTMTLFVPSGSPGFVDPNNGEISLRRILLPVDREPAPARAIAYTARAAIMSHESPVDVDLLRVGDRDDWPALDLPDLRTCRWNRIRRSGEVVDEIAKAAEETNADLIVMGTKGAKGILGAMRGSVTEQVIRRASCPVLAVPQAE